MADLTVTASQVSADWNRGSVIKEYIAGVALTVGQVIYLDTNNKAQIADADVLTLNSRTVGVVCSSPNWYGETTIPAGAYAPVCIAGPVYGFSSLSSGQFGWVSKTAGKITDTAPTGGAFQYAVGFAEDSDTFFVRTGMTTPASV